MLTPDIVADPVQVLVPESQLLVPVSGSFIGNPPSQDLTANQDANQTLFQPPGVPIDTSDPVESRPPPQVPILPSQQPQASLAQTDETPMTSKSEPEPRPEHYVFVPDFYPQVDPAFLATDPSVPAVLSSHYAAVDALSWIPEEIFRVPTGSSVAEPDSVLGVSGRFYHGYHEGKYYLPNDGAEQDRLDFQDEAFKILLAGRLGLAPIESPKTVLDVATGTGIWAVEFANAHPESRVIGTDLSKIQPENAPDNVEFIKEDSEEEWLYGCKFDYVHLRAVFSCFDDPRKVMRHAFANLNPGGYIEYLDGTFEVESMDGSADGTALRKWGELLIQGAAVKGRDIEVAKHYKEWLLEVGFIDIVEVKIAWACSAWPKDRTLKLAGKYMNQQLKEGLRGLGFTMLSALGWTTEQIGRITLDARADLDNPAIHAFIPLWVIYARKPLEPELNNTVKPQTSEESR